MIFYIQDGRNTFYQWDIDRKLIVTDATITEVHFCNKTSDCSLVVEVKEQGGARVVDVPNILLQTDWDIKVYAYCGDCYTKQAATFKVKARTKPADYVYTETEVKRWEELEARVEEQLNESNKLVEDATKAIEDVTKAVEDAEAEIEKAKENYYTKTEVDNAISNVKVDLPIEKGNGLYSVRMNHNANNKAEGESSLALGNSTNAKGKVSIAGGNGCETADNGAVALGYQCKANGKYSFALGHSTEANDVAAVALGYGTIANKQGQVVVGKYNADKYEGGYTTKNTESYFIVGGGANSKERANAFEIYQEKGAVPYKYAMRLGDQSITPMVLGELRDFRNDSLIKNRIKIGNTYITEEQAKKLLSLIVELTTLTIYCNNDMKDAPIGEIANYGNEFIVENENYYVINNDIKKALTEENDISKHEKVTQYTYTEPTEDEDEPYTETYNYYQYPITIKNSDYIELAVCSDSGYGSSYWFVNSINCSIEYLGETTFEKYDEYGSARDVSYKFYRIKDIKENPIVELGYRE